MSANAAIYGFLGPSISPDERSFFREAEPFGFILFARNCVSPDQILRLTNDLREIAGRENVPILIDQEGGRVQRLRPPHWAARPPARNFGRLHASDPDTACRGAYLCSRLIAAELTALGINVDCAPVLDVPVPGSHDVIGDRAFAEDPDLVITLARFSMDGFLDGGVLPVIKHIPGHGRATADSHLALPRVGASHSELSARDFAPFRALNDAPMAMTAHVVYEALDPDRPATTSKKLVRDIIRREIGFDGLLMSDDLSMSALEGPFATRTRQSLEAGCDVVLHCNGRMDEMIEIASAVPILAGRARERAEAALSKLRPPGPFDVAAANAALGKMMGAVP